MEKRIRKLRFQIWKAGGVDIVVTHAPPDGVGSLDDPAHKGFKAFLAFLDKYKPQYLLHGHVHLRYGQDRTRERVYGSTQVINVGERFVLDIPDREVPASKENRLIWAKKIKEDSYNYF